MSELNKLLVFLSHVSEDKPKVWELFRRLKADGFDPWLDEERILPGQDWDLEIQKAMRESQAILLCFSRFSVAKEGYIQREYKKAQDYQNEKPEGTIFNIPVRLDDCEIPFTYHDLQWVEFPAGYDRLAKALNLRAEKVNAAKAVVQPKAFKQVQLIIQGDFKNFNETKQQDLVAVLGALLRVDSNDIRILQVHSGSIIIVVEMPETAAFRLKAMASKGNFRLKAKGFLSIQIENDEEILLSTNNQKKANLDPHVHKAKTGGPIYNIDTINVGRDLIQSDQTNFINNVTNIQSPTEFVTALEQVLNQVAEIKKGQLTKVQARNLDAVETCVMAAVDETYKPQPVGERIQSTLREAKESLDLLSGSLGAAATLGTTLGGLVMIAVKIFGG